jgi:putative CocE/NonD family hydrolase
MSIINKELHPVEINPMFEGMLEERREDMPPVVCGVGGYFLENVEMCDGVKLVTKIIVPDEGEKWPVLYTRSPYPITWAMEPTIMLPFVEQGYCVVIQSCRGGNGSGGEYDPFQNEREDGIDAINWLVKQPWHNGNIATYGASYMCYTQWIVADHMPAEVKTMYLESFGIDRYSQMYGNGMFRHDIYTSWALQNCRVEIADLPKTYLEALQVRPHNTMDEKLLGKKLPFYQDFISKTERSDPYWQDSFWEVLRTIPSKINVPVCIAEGWNDHNIEGVMTGIMGLRPEIRKSSKIVLGPWDHMGQEAGEMEYPDSDKYGTMNAKLMIAWFDRMLKGICADEPPVSEFYTIGEGKWRNITQWPPATEKHVYFLGGGGSLTSIPPQTGSETYEYDPANPVETVGGNALLAWMGGLGDTDHGPQLQPDYSDRGDVLIFTSEPLMENVTLAGGAEVFLEVATTAPDTSFMVKLSEEFPDGRTINIVDGASSILLRNESDTILDYTPGEKVVLKIRLWDTAWQVQKGSRLRLDVTSSNFPMYHIHPNRTGIWSEHEGWDKANQTVYFGTENSAVYLPILK